MASNVKTTLKQELLDILCDAGYNLTLILCMTNTTLDTEGITDSRIFISDYTTLDEFNGANYVRKALANEQAIRDNVNARSNAQADTITWVALGAGTRPVAGAALIADIGGLDSTRLVLGWYDKPATPDGNDFIVRFNAQLAAGDFLRFF